MFLEFFVGDDLVFKLCWTESRGGNVLMPVRLENGVFF